MTQIDHDLHFHCSIHPFFSALKLSSLYANLVSKKPALVKSEGKPRFGKVSSDPWTNLSNHKIQRVSLLSASFVPLSLVVWSIFPIPFWPFDHHRSPVPPGSRSIPG
jgi:hypothetical protein